MVTWIVRLVLVVAGVIASWLIAEDAVKFPVVQMTVAVLIIVFGVMVAAFWWRLWRRKTTNSPGQSGPAPEGMSQRPSRAHRSDDFGAN